MLRWIGVMLAAAAVDLLVRFSGFASFNQVLRVEALLFPLTALALYLLFRSGPRLSGFRRGLQVVLIWAFFLAGLRSGIWAAGFAVGAANLVIFLVALLAWLGFRIVRRRRAKTQ